LPKNVKKKVKNPSDYFIYFFALSFSIKKEGASPLKTDLRNIS